MVYSHSRVLCSSTLDAMPGDLYLYVYLNIEMDFLCGDAKPYFKSVECSDCRQHFGCNLPFRSWSVIG